MQQRARPLIAGNWKMNGVKASAAELNEMIVGYDADLAGRLDLLICPPVTLLISFAVVTRGSGIQVGAQDCHAAAGGAHTGDLSAEMLRDAGAVACIVGHSERRADHGESDPAVRAKAEAALRAGLVALVCVGETEAERDAGAAVEVVGGQLAGSLPAGATLETLVVAYEPVWAIGTGRTPTAADIRDMHASIRARLVEGLGEDGGAVRILYGGSVKPANAGEILALDNVDGALVGGASLKAADFLGIARAAG